MTGPSRRRIDHDDVLMQRGISDADAAQWRVRLRAAAHRRALDRQIAQGARVDLDPARSLRVRQLTSIAERRATAACLANILDAAEERERALASPLIVDHLGVIGARADILSLIDLLRGPSQLNARGLAMARLLADDPASPLLGLRPGRTVADAMAETMESLY